MFVQLIPMACNGFNPSFFFLLQGFLSIIFALSRVCRYHSVTYTRMCNRTANKTIERRSISDQQPNQQNPDRNPVPTPPAVAPSNPISTSIASASSSNGNMEKKNSLPAVETIREYDVLMGRGSGPNRHSGNVHFRAIVGEVFDEFLSKHGADRSMMGEAGSDMMRIDPSTKNRLAQTVLDRITIKKNGRFLQKLNKKELADAFKKGEDGKLIRARSYSLMDAAMATALARKAKNGTLEDTGDEKQEINANAVVFYKIIPEKQILAKIKQTFRFLRDQNEASTVEKHRQIRKRAARGTMPAQATVGVTGLQSQHPGGLAGARLPMPNANAFALMNCFGMNGVNGLNANTPNLSNMIPGPTPLSNNGIKTLNDVNPQGASMDLASRLLCDLPQANRIISTSNGQSQQPLYQGSVLTAAANQLNGNTDASTKRLLEQLTISRLANLQKQRDDTITAYLTHAAPPSAGTPTPAPALSSPGVLQSPSPLQNLASAHQQQLQQLLNLNTAAVAPSPINANPDTLSLLLQLQQQQRQLQQQQHQQQQQQQR